MTSRWGQQNSLARRVQQHGAFTTLFRSTAASATGRRLAPMPFVLGQMTPPLLPETAVAASPMAASWAETDPTAAWTTTDPDTPAVEEPTQSFATVQPTTLVAMSAPPAIDSPAFSAPSLPRQRPTLAAPERAVQPAVNTPPPLPASLPVQRQMLPPADAFSTGAPATIATSHPLSSPSGVAVATRVPPLVTASLSVAPPSGSPPPPALAAPAATLVATAQPGGATAIGALPYQPAAAPDILTVQPGGSGQVTGAATPVAPGAQAATPASPPLPPPSAVQRQADPTATSGDGIDDRTWSRLQSAFRKAKAQASEGASTPQPPPTVAAPVTRTPVVAAQRQAERGVLRRTAISEQSAGQPFLTSPSAVRPSAVAPALPPAVAQPVVSSEAMAPPMLQRSPAVVVGHQAADVTTGNLPPPAGPPSTSAGNPSVENPAAPPAVSGEEQLQSPSLIGEPALSPSAPAALNMAAPTTLPAVSIGAPSLAPITNAPLSAPSVMTAPAVVQRTATALPPGWPAPTQPDTAPEQSLALEAVWPVQRLSAPTAFAPAATAGDRLQADLPAAEPLPVLAEPVRRQLEATQTARPTESKVDILAPRRPHPLLRSATPSVETVAGSDPVQRQSEEAPLAAPSSQVRQTEAMQPALVPTQIGPLPADLWRLIGAQPPAPEPAVTAPEPTAPPPAVAAVATPTTSATRSSSIQMAPVANASASAHLVQSAPTVSAAPTTGEALPAADSLPGWPTPIAAPVETPIANSAIPARFTAAPAVVAPLSTDASAGATASVAQISAPITSAAEPAPATTAAVQMKANATTTVPPAANEKRSTPSPLLVTQQASPTLLRQSEPPVAEPTTADRTPATSGKKKRRKRSTPTK